MTNTHASEWLDPDHAQGFLDRREQLPQLEVGYSELLSIVPDNRRRVLDLGCGDGKVMSLIGGSGVAVDFSPHMLEQARARFHADDVEVVAHDLNAPLPDLGTFDLIVSAFAIHHCPHDRKRALYGEVFELLEPGGMFANLEHVASPTPALHSEFLGLIGSSPETEDPSNQLLAVETQLGWLREIGFAEVECFWKWRELALLAGRKPPV
ncbi:MAG: class I SAM-dependent methyltransferase [Acidimicrobiia bacterium]|nr:class I SAM-dependent methyltransferase [Acidimicrobiia bacterium]